MLMVDDPLIWNKFMLSNPHSVALAYIFLEGIEVDIEIGVTPQEEGRIQRLFLDVRVGFDDKKTRIPDSKEGLKEGLDYARILECVHAATSKKTYLLETVANLVADDVLSISSAITCAVKVSKKRCWPNVDRTGIEIFRTQSRSDN